MNFSEFILEYILAIFAVLIKHACVQKVNGWLIKNVLQPKFTSQHFFFYQGFLLRTLTTHRTAGEEFRHLFSTLHVGWLSHIFSRTACIYQTDTRWDLPPYRITIWLIDDVMLIFVYLFDDMILGFCYNILTLGKPVDSNSHHVYFKLGFCNIFKHRGCIIKGDQFCLFWKIS